MAIMVSDEAKTALQRLGARIREARLDRNESQVRFAARVGVSLPTLRKLEAGDPRVNLGLMAEALFILGHLDELGTVLAPPKDDLFAIWEAQQRQAKRRQRARNPVPKNLT